MIDVLIRRFPRGKRGLKYPDNDFLPGLKMSLPSREAWIEITDDEEYMHLIIILIVMA